MRSYSRRNMSKNSSLDAVNALFAENMSRRKQAKRRKKVNIRELPPPDPNVQLSDSSLKVEINNTFDRLKEGSVYKPVGLKDCAIDNFSSESDISKSRSRLPQISFSHVINSPVIKRKRKKKLKSNAKITELIVSEIKKQEEDTFDKPVLSSLEVEKATLSIKRNSTGEIRSLCNGSVASKGFEVKPTDISYEPIFSNTFRERVLAVSKICSTPNVSSAIDIPAKQHEIVSEISPIPAWKPKTSSLDVLEASYREIHKWDSKFPIESTPLSKKCSTPKLPKRSKRISSKTVSVRYFEHEKESCSEIDPKLKMWPHVALYNSLQVPGIGSKLQSSSTGGSLNKQSILSNLQISSNTSHSNNTTNSIVSHTNNEIADSNTKGFIGFTQQDVDYATKTSFAQDKSVTSEIRNTSESILQSYVAISRLTDDVIQLYKCKRLRQSLPSLLHTDRKLNQVPIVWLSRNDTADYSNNTQQKIVSKEPLGI